MRPASFATLLASVFLLAISCSLALAQQTPTPSTAPGGTPATPAAGGGGVADWWWVILVVIVVAAVIWYFMRGKRTRT